MIAAAAHSACFRATSARRGDFQIAWLRYEQFTLHIDVIRSHTLETILFGLTSLGVTNYFCAAERRIQEFLDLTFQAVAFHLRTIDLGRTVASP